MYESVLLLSALFVLSNAESWLKRNDFPSPLPHFKIWIL